MQEREVDNVKCENNVNLLGTTQ